jgi:hypothetical protein
MTIGAARIGIILMMLASQYRKNVTTAIVDSV